MKKVCSKSLNTDNNHTRITYSFIMELSKIRYIIVLSFQMSFIILDLLFNTLSNSLLRSNYLLFIFLLQDFILLLTFVLVLITFFQTNVFQAGFMKILYGKFWSVILVSLLYIVITISLHTWTLIIRWNSSFFKHWPIGFYVYYITQRTASVVYYYIYKRTTLRISDQRLYEDEWINHVMNHQE